MIILEEVIQDMPQEMAIVQTATEDAQPLRIIRRNSIEAMGITQPISH